MGDRKLVLISNTEEIPISYSVLSAHTENGLLYTAANNDLHLLLREPALLELARRGHEATIPICRNLLSDDDSEKWFLVLRALVALANPEAVELIMSLLESGPSQSRILALQMLGKIVTPMFRDKFRHIVRNLVVPGILNISGWTPTAIRVLYGLCEKEDIEVVTSSSEDQITVPSV